ncbi:Aldo/keto reductase family protein [Handroanthus impetiginosus]|uniref:Aldo/keto reductase family protein n=1 Tax=Handroanthus impetiginosus TaxID=429701 RepID=A0A2G9G9N0_9LAMI|nr:Aldo/keto reductase family protein [Handroanthus impetiginosus]
MPVLKFGTETFSSVKADDELAALQAIERGYRHFDTVSHYGSEEAVGEAIAEALDRGLIKSREELFVTSKLWCSDAHAERVLPALKKTLDKMLCRWWRYRRFRNRGKKNFERTSKPLQNAYFVVVIMGIFQSITCSDYSKLCIILVELNPCWQRKRLIDLCKSKGIVATSFSPLGVVGTVWGSNGVVDNEVLKENAKAKGKSVPQVCLRWAYQQGVAIVVKSYKPERMQENCDIFDQELSDEERKKISEIIQSRGHEGEDFVSEDGPIKSVDELWDGELRFLGLIMLF